jgi:predicted transposase YdaD
MTRFRYDRSSKWLLQHHGDLILRLGGVQDVVSWRPLQAEVVQPRQLPDGLLEVERAGQGRRDLYVVEIATYPDRRVAEQVTDDVTLVLQDRRVLPEVLVLVLSPKGNLKVEESLELHSAGGWTRLRLVWRVVELWTIEAGDLLATREPSLMPWVPLTHFDRPPEAVLQECREVIEEKAAPEEHSNLLAVTQVFAGLCYNDPGLLALFGGKEAMIESPVLQELIQEMTAKRAHKMILRVLQDRFGPVPAEVSDALRAVTDEERLDQLASLAARCTDLEAFRRELTP